jgi:hypothetical protein
LLQVQAATLPGSSPKHQEEQEMKRWIAASAFALALAFGPGIDAHAGDVFCPPNIGPVTVDGNVRVVGGCTLERTTVLGNVHVQSGGSLNARRANIGGNVQTDGDGARRVRLHRTDVGGSVQLETMNGPLPSIIERTTTGGSIQVEKNVSPLEVYDNRVGQDVQAKENRGGVRIELNEINGNLQCQENRPAPTGGGNLVGGNKEDQCERL